MATTQLRTTHVVALAGSAAGLLALIPGSPSGLRFALLGAFVLVAPGSAVIDFLRLTQPSLKLFLVPCIGIAATLLVSTVAVDYTKSNPTVILLVLVALTLVATALGAVRRSLPEPSHAREQPERSA